LNFVFFFLIAILDNCPTAVYRTVNSCKQPPVKVFGIEGRYATALFSAGSKQNQLEAIEKDLVKFQVGQFVFVL